MYVVHCTQYVAVNCTSYTTYYLHCITYSVHSMQLQIVHRTPRTLYSVHRTLYDVVCSVGSMYSVGSTYTVRLYAVHYRLPTLYDVQCTKYIYSRTVYGVHWVPRMGGVPEYGCVYFLLFPECISIYFLLLPECINIHIPLATVLQFRSSGTTQPEQRGVLICTRCLDFLQYLEQVQIQ